MVRTIQVEKVREYYREKEMFFGLIKCEEIQRVESIGNELRIATQEAPEKVVINGLEYVVAE